MSLTSDQHNQIRELAKLRKQKFERRQRLEQKRKYDTERASLRVNGVIQPIVERCVDCDKKTKHHHFLCDTSWNRKHKFKNNR